MKKKQKIRRTVISLIITTALVSFFIISVKKEINYKKMADFSILAPDYIAGSENNTQIIPDFELYDRQKNKIKLSQFEPYSVLIINIWASFCEPCKEEMPSLVRLDELLLKNVKNAALITITVDKSWEDVQSFFPHGTNLRVLFDPEGKVIKKIFGTDKYPETFVLNKKRQIVARFDGPRKWHLELFLDYLKKI